MPLGLDKVHELIKSKSLVENLSERELSNPEGAGIEVRVEEVYKMNGEGFLGVDERKTPESELVARFGKEKSYVLKPDEYILLKSIERVNVPEDIEVFITPRSTLLRSGILLLFAQVDPGYTGALTFGMKNVGKQKFELEMGARIAKLFFFKVDGKANVYRGQWKGGRVSTEKKERQV